MVEQKEEDYIKFDNLVQADSDVAGKNVPVKARKEAEKERKYAQANAKGELYVPKDFDDVATRAENAGNRFKRLFKIS